VIRICCDSGAQLDPALAERHGIEVVPLTVRIDGMTYLEGVDLDADGFWAMFENAHTPGDLHCSAVPGPVRRGLPPPDR